MAYTPTEWKDGDIITAERLNKLEAGVQNEQVGPQGPKGDAGATGPKAPRETPEKPARRAPRGTPAKLDRRAPPERTAPRAIPAQPGPLEQTGSLLRASPSPQTAPGK